MPLVLDGGKGSGNFGHAGRPGKIGGSSSNSPTTNSFSIDNDSNIFNNEGEAVITFNELNLNSDKGFYKDNKDDEEKIQRFNQILELNKSEFINFLNSNSYDSYKQNYEEYEKELADASSDLSFYLNYPSLLDTDGKNKFFAIAYGSLDVDNIYKEADVKNVELDVANADNIQTTRTFDKKHQLFLASGLSFLDKNELEGVLKNETVLKDLQNLYIPQGDSNFNQSQAFLANYFVNKEGLINNADTIKINKEDLDKALKKAFSEAINSKGFKRIGSLQNFLAMSAVLSSIAEKSFETDAEFKQALKQCYANLNNVEYLKENNNEDMNSFFNDFSIDFNKSKYIQDYKLTDSQKNILSIYTDRLEAEQDASFLSDGRKGMLDYILKGGYELSDIFKDGYSEQDIKDISKLLDDASNYDFLQKPIPLYKKILACAIQDLTNLDSYEGDEREGKIKDFLDNLTQDGYKNSIDTYTLDKHDIKQDAELNLDFYNDIQLNTKAVDVNKNQAEILSSIGNLLDLNVADTSNLLGIGNWRKFFNVDISEDDIGSMAYLMSTYIQRQDFDGIKRGLQKGITSDTDFAKNKTTNLILEAGMYSASKLKQDELKNYSEAELMDFLKDVGNHIKKAINGEKTDLHLTDNASAYSKIKDYDSLSVSDYGITGKLIKADTKELDGYIDTLLEDVNVDNQFLHFNRTDGIVLDKKVLNSIREFDTSNSEQDVKNKQWGCEAAAFYMTHCFVKTKQGRKEKVLEELQKHKNDLSIPQVYGYVVALQQLSKLSDEEVAAMSSKELKPLLIPKSFNKGLIQKNKITENVSNSYKSMRIASRYKSIKNKPEIKSNFLDTTVVKDTDMNKDKWTGEESTSFINKLIPCLNISDGFFKELEYGDEVKKQMGISAVSEQQSSSFASKSKTNSNYALERQEHATKFTPEPIIEKMAEGVSQKYAYSEKDLRTIADLMTRSGYWYTSAIQEDNMGMGSFLRTVVGSSPIYEGEFLRCESVNDSYRDYDNIKIGDSVNFNAQHFTYDPVNFGSKANGMFGDVGFKVKGKMPFFNLTPFSRPSKDFKEWEGLVAGCFKVVGIQNDVEMYGANFSKMFEIEFDWEKWKSYIHTNAKMFGNQMGLYDRNSKMKVKDFLSYIRMYRNNLNCLHYIQLNRLIRKGGDF